MDAFGVIQSLAVPTSGDIAGQGQGSTMAQRGNPGVVAAVAPTAGAPAVSNPFGGGGEGLGVVAWVAVLVLLLVLKFAAEHGSDEKEFASIRVGFWSFLVITIVAVLGINAAKWIFSTWHIPGVSSLVLAS